MYEELRDLTVNAVTSCKEAGMFVLRERQETSECRMKIFESHYSHLCNCQTGWLRLCQVSVTQTGGPVHISDTSPAPSISLCLPTASAHFTLTNVQEQAAPGSAVGGGEGSYGSDLMDKCLREALLRALILCTHIQTAQMSWGFYVEIYLNYALNI